MAVFAGPKIVEDGLIMYLDAVNQKSYPGSGTSWIDLANPSTHAIAYNSPVFNSQGFFTFDGPNDFFRFTRTDLNGGTFAYPLLSIILWLKPSSSGGTTATGNNIITIENSIEISIGNNENGYSSIAYASNPWSWRYFSGDYLVNDSWNQIVYVHDFSKRTVYVNGIEIGNYANSGNISTGNGSYPYLTLMGRYSGTSSQAEGSLSLVKMYNRGISAAEIKQNFEALRGRFGI